MIFLLYLTDGHARADRRANETQADHSREAEEAPGASRAHAHLSPARIFSAVICCTQLLVRPHEVVDNVALAVMYLRLIKQHDRHLFPLAAALAIVRFQHDRASAILFASAILLQMDALDLAACLGHFAMLYVKPFDVYTLAVIVSVLVRVLTVSLVTVFDVLLEFMQSNY